MEKKIVLSIIIVSYNTKNLLENCLHAIKSNSKGLNHEIIVVDNHSSDGSQEMVKKYFSTVKLIQNSENLGFGKANNLGSKQAIGEYLLFLNSDVVVKHNSIADLLKYIEKHPKTGLLGPKLINADNSAQASVYHFPTIFGAIKEFWFDQNGAYEKYLPQGYDPVGVDAVVGAAMLVSRKIFNKVGGFDEKYFMYFEDLDLCQRLMKNGYEIIYHPGVEMLHYHGASSQKMGTAPQKWLVESSKKYNGIVKYWLLYFVIWMGVWGRKFFGPKR